jgi:rRNA maturation protein Rpf1
MALKIHNVKYRSRKDSRGLVDESMFGHHSFANSVSRAAGLLSVARQFQEVSNTDRRFSQQWNDRIAVSMVFGQGVNLFSLVVRSLA